MDLFIEIELAKTVSEDDEETTYEISHKSLPEKHELEYFLKKIYDMKKDKPQELDSSNMEKLEKYFPKD